ncbi:MAG: branched-chain amino acid ABC transporter permease, partial [Desulfobacterales bacterium]|nr:branched-chain amino acid ABC transporter permease [Desulfobacterales bacterium]
MSGKITLYILLAPTALLLGLLPLWAGSYALVWFFLLFVYLTLALSYDIMGGYTGYINLGHATSFGLGAYTTAILLNHGLGLFFSLAAAGFLAGSFAAMVGYPLFRLRGPYFAMATFGLISLMEVVCTNLRDLTGGSGGLSTPSGNHTLLAYYLGGAAVAGTMALSRGVARSRFGR